jgi:phosphoglycolate phosphatase
MSSTRSRSRLLLFDIDGTLLDTGGAGAASLLEAAVDVLGADLQTLPPLDLAGATDGGVVRKLFADTGHDLHPEKITAFQESYLNYLEQKMNAPDFAGNLLAGVTPLLAALAQEPRFSLGLLTGNLRRGAFIKLNRMGIASHFVDGGFGDDGIHRNELGPVAVQRMMQKTMLSFAPEDIIVIGDTPKDVACAHAMQARCLAVATGRFDVASLTACEAWQVLPDLSDTKEVLSLLD